MAELGNQHAKGNIGGRSFQDREKASVVRSKVLDCLEMILNDDLETNDWSDYKKDIIRRMSTSILPRLNAGRDDSERLVPEPILNNVLSNNSHQEDSETEGED